CRPCLARGWAKPLPTRSKQSEQRTSLHFGKPYSSPMIRPTPSTPNRVVGLRLLSSREYAVHLAELLLRNAGSTDRNLLLGFKEPAIIPPSRRFARSELPTLPRYIRPGAESGVLLH